MDQKVVVVNRGPGCCGIAVGTCFGLVLFSLIPIFLLFGGCALLFGGAAAVTSAGTDRPASAAGATPAPTKRPAAAPAMPPGPTIETDPQRDYRLKAAREGDPRDRDSK